MSAAATGSADAGSAIQRTSEDGLTTLRLSRPEVMNALTLEVKTALETMTKDFFADPDQRCLLVTGSGEAFCAGGDLETLVHGHSPAQTCERLSLSHSWARRLLLGGKPVIMAVNGAAAGAGFSLAMMGDVILASESAYFLPGFAQVGVAPDLALGWTLPRAIGLPRAKDILLNNRRIDAAEAERLGMVSRVVSPDDLLPVALDMGRRLARGASLAQALTKDLLTGGYEQPLDAFLASELAAQMQTFASYDCREGVSAFFDHRKPVFKGR
jgi:2-(1,2-epoxy-1,2-dihydrophenyl)acetyl-CoA isomerase